MQQSMLRGRCLCGAVTYSIATSLKRITHCHCSMCRKQHGAAFATYALIGREHVTIADAGGRLRSYRSSPGMFRQFCGECGSTLFGHAAATPQLIDVALGTLDDDPEKGAFAHI